MIKVVWRFIAPKSPINKQKQEMKMMSNIPFDHIKILDDGNFGCTLKLGKEIFCAVYTPKWEIVKPLHKVDTDHYSDYTYIRDDNSLTITSSYYNGQYESVEEMGKRVFGEDSDITYDLSDFDIVVDDFIGPFTSTTNDEDEYIDMLVFFSIQYKHKDDESVLILENVLAPYQLIGTTAINEIFRKHKDCKYDIEKTMEALNISADTEIPLQKAILQIIEWSNSIKNIFDIIIDQCFWFEVFLDSAFEKYAFLKQIRNEFATQATKDICYYGWSKFPMLIYIEYLKKYAPEMCDSDALMF